MGFLTLLFMLLILPFQATGSDKAIFENDLQKRETVVVLHDSLLKNTFKEIHLPELKGWKFSPEDNPAFASAAYDDSGWYTLEKAPSEEGAIPDSLWKGFGWFRLTVKIDSSFASHALLQGYGGGSGAVELFINDSLVYSRGKPGFDVETQELKSTTSEFGSFYDFLPGETYEIAVKYSFHNYDAYKFFVINRPVTDFGIHLFSRDSLGEAFSEKGTISLFLGIGAVILMMVMLLHLFMFLQIKGESANFWIFLITSLIFFFSVSVNLNVQGKPENYNNHVALAFFVSLALTGAMGLIPLVTHKVLHIKPAKFWLYYPLMAVVSMLIYDFIAFLQSDLAQKLNVPLAILLGLVSFYGGIRGLLAAKRAKRRDIYLIAIPILSFPILLMGTTIMFNLLEIKNVVIPIASMMAIFTIIPVGMSIYQAKRFLRMHTELDQMVQDRTTDLEKAFRDLEQSHKTLKEAQKQLVQQEKLASLGQLTAGIAHEIKNPLNFVNNFSEVCVELIEEAKEEIQLLKKEEANSEALENIQDVLVLVEGNLKKIYEHGSRADGIVKSMLFHSRGGSGQMELTDLNKVIREYVNLAYHGMRAGKKPINVSLELDLDPKIEKVPLIAEDFSRVILNLCNNAFDAMREKLETQKFSPTLHVQTLLQRKNILIKVSDNGTGISKDHLEKILQPFFTTKKGTEGTGLGLSISNEIVRAQGGKMEVSSTPGEGTTFTVLLKSSVATVEKPKTKAAG